MDSTIIVAIIGVIGIIISSSVSQHIAHKEYKLKLQEHNSSDMIELISKYKTMCDDLERKVEKLEEKVNNLEKENLQLKEIIHARGIELINNGGE